MAADCPPVTATGYGMTCDPFLTNGTTVGYRVYVNNVVATMVYPNLEQCVPEVADAAVLGGLVVSALAAAFALKILWRAF